jgi:hypothetical protein
MIMICCTIVEMCQARKRAGSISILQNALRIHRYVRYVSVEPSHFWFEARRLFDCETLTVSYETRRQFCQVSKKSVLSIIVLLVRSKTPNRLASKSNAIGSRPASSFAAPPAQDADGLLFVGWERCRRARGVAAAGDDRPSAATGGHSTPLRDRGQRAAPKDGSRGREEDGAAVPPPGKHPRGSEGTERADWAEG